MGCREAHDLEFRAEGLPESIARLLPPARAAPEEVVVRETDSAVVLTLQAVRQTMEETRGLSSPDSGAGHPMEEVMASLETRGAPTT